MLNKEKIQENARYLGLAQVKIDNTEKRSAVRKLLNGLGFKTEDYIELTMPQLESIYNGLLASVGSPLEQIKNMTVEKRSSAINDFQDAVKGMDMTIMPVIEQTKPIRRRLQYLVMKGRLCPYRQVTVTSKLRHWQHYAH